MRSPEWPFPIIVGTSAGAVSASILAGNVTRWHQSVGEIEKVWANFRVAQVFRSDAMAMLKAGARWMGSLFTGGMIGPPKSLLDNSPLRELLSKVTDFDAIRVQRGARRPACAGVVRHQLFHRALGVVLRGRDHHQRMVAGAAARRTRAAVARLPDGQSRHSVPVSADVPARRVLRRRRDAPDRAAESRRFTWAPIALLVLGVRPTHLDLIPRFVASDSPPTPGQLFGYMLDTLFSDQISADLENLNRINRLSEAGRRRDRHAPDPHHDDRARASILRRSPSGTSTRCP